MGFENVDEHVGVPFRAKGRRLYGSPGIWLDVGVVVLGQSLLAGYCGAYGLALVRFVMDRVESQGSVLIAVAARGMP